MNVTECNFRNNVISLQISKPIKVDPCMFFLLAHSEILTFQMFDPEIRLRSQSAASTTVSFDGKYPYLLKSPYAFALALTVSEILNV